MHFNTHERNGYADRVNDPPAAQIGLQSELIVKGQSQRERARESAKYV